MSSITGYGECNKKDADCGKWCFVDDNANCFETNPSKNGDPYRWTCEACSAATIQRGIGFLLFGLLGFKIKNCISVSHSSACVRHTPPTQEPFLPICSLIFILSQSPSDPLRFHKLYQLFDNCHYCYYYVMIIVVMIIVSVLLL